MQQNGFHTFAQRWLPQVEAEMRALLSWEDPQVAPLYQMMAYHLGWVDQTFRPGDFPAGKRVRPLFCLMACEAVGGDPSKALPAAAGVELLHNFSLIHDDLQDGDETRRHRPTVWRLWGAAQAINVGDGMFALAYAALLRLAERGMPDGVVLQAVARFNQACQALTEGQYLDMRFEQQERVTVSEYMRMIRGKTASLIAASLALGGLLGGGRADQVEGLARFGESIGLAFQIRDDILGIWGDPGVTGKPVGNDILREKKSLPLLHALAHPRVGERLQGLLQEAITPARLPAIMALLEEAGSRPFAEQELVSLHQAGVRALEEALGVHATSSPLMALADELLQRQA